MKFAHLMTPTMFVSNVFDVSTPTRRDDVVEVEITEDQATQVAEAVKPLFLIDGELTEDRKAYIVPTEVSNWQLRKAVNQLGFRTEIEALIAGADQDTKDGWNVAKTAKIDDPFLVAAVALLNWPEGRVEQIFRLAATL